MLQYMARHTWQRGCTALLWTPVRTQQTWSNPLRNMDLFSKQQDNTGTISPLSVQAALHEGTTRPPTKQDERSVSQEMERRRLQNLQYMENIEIREQSLNTRLGIRHGRTVEVIHGDTVSAFQRLNKILREDNIPADKRKQRFYMKPCKVLRERRQQTHRKRFKQSFLHTIQQVKDARRRGY